MVQIRMVTASSGWITTTRPIGNFRAELAIKLARQTTIGAAALSDKEKQTDAKILRENVTSPGGTTQAALDVLMDGRLQKLYDEAILAATKRSKELNQ